MVDQLIKVAPTFYVGFNNRFDLGLQKTVTSKLYEIWRLKLLDANYSCNQPQYLKAEEYINSCISGLNFQGNYFKNHRKFENLVPTFYKRTAAPRITTTGTTFHGMKGDFSSSIQYTLLQNHQGSFVDIDLSACHTRIASRMLGPGSDVSRSIRDSTFWDTQANKYLKEYESHNISLDFKTVRKILKVCLYTSLNVGFL
jgi:hypothetical protein